VVLGVVLRRLCIILFSFLGWFIVFLYKFISEYSVLVISKETDLEFVLGSHLGQREMHFSLLYPQLWFSRKLSCVTFENYSSPPLTTS
jgi:hypothetical protein